MGPTEKKILDAFLSIKKESFSKDDIIFIINSVYESNKREVFVSNGVTVNPEKCKVEYNGKSFSIPRKEFQLLQYLILNKNKVVRRENILKSIWGNDVIVIDRTIDVHIRKIRSILWYDCIKTVKGVGYSWEEK